MHKPIPNVRSERTPFDRRATALSSPTASISRREPRRVATTCANIWCIRERNAWKTNQSTSGSRDNLDRSQGQPPIGPTDYAATKGPAGAFLLEPLEPRISRIDGRQPAQGECVAGTLSPIIGGRILRWLYGDVPGL